MVNVAAQLSEVLSSLCDTSVRTGLRNYLSGMSYIMKDIEGEGTKIYPYIDNRLDIIKDIFLLEIQQCHQRLTRKKIKRLRLKLEEGKIVFIRMYDLDNQNLEDFCYKRVGRIRRSWNGWNIEFADGSKICRTRLSLLYGLIFRKYRDWAVYEDINFRMSSSGQPVQVEENYISRWKNRMRCISCNKARNTLNKNKEVSISADYIEQRKQVYDALKGSRFFSEEDTETLNTCINKYSQKVISIKELYKCFDLEYQLLKKMEERIG